MKTCGLTHHLICGCLSWPCGNKGKESMLAKCTLNNSLLFRELFFWSEPWHGADEIGLSFCLVSHVRYCYCATDTERLPPVKTGEPTVLLK